MIHLFNAGKDGNLQNLLERARPTSESESIASRDGYQSDDEQDLGTSVKDNGLSSNDEDSADEGDSRSESTEESESNGAEDDKNCNDDFQSVIAAKNTSASENRFQQSDDSDDDLFAKSVSPLKGRARTSSKGESRALQLLSVCFIFQL